MIGMSGCVLSTDTKAGFGLIDIPIKSALGLAISFGIMFVIVAITLIHDIWKEYKKTNSKIPPITK